jgi:hypothetical protein
MSAQTPIFVEEIRPFGPEQFAQIQRSIAEMNAQQVYICSMFGLPAHAFEPEYMPEPEPAAESPYDPPPARVEARNENSPRKPWQSRKWAPKGRK